jgi:hypothetical protein
MSLVNMATTTRNERVSVLVDRQNLPVNAEDISLRQPISDATVNGFT